MPQAGKDFFNSLSSFLCDTLYVAATFNKQRGSRIRPTHKIPPNSNGFGGANLFGRNNTAHQSTVFLFGGLCNQFHYAISSLVIGDIISYSKRLYIV